MRTTKASKSFFEMSAEERTRAAHEFDGPLPSSRCRPLSPKKRLLWEKARAAQGAAAVHVRAGRTDFVVALDEDLLARAREFAARHNTTLPKMIDRGLRGLLAFAG